MRPALLCLFAVLLTATTCKSIRNPCVCLKTSNTKVPASRIRSYSIQKPGLCHIAAVVFKTVRGHTVCADPKKPWVTEAMQLVDAKKRIISTTASPMSIASHRTVITTGGSYNTS